MTHSPRSPLASLFGHRGSAASRLGYLPLIVSLSFGCGSPPPPACGLVGTWRFVEVVDWDSSGAPSYAFSQAPLGYLIYTGTGHMSVHLGTRADSTSRPDAGPQHVPYTGYFGTYAVNPACSVVTHFVEGSSTGEYLETPQPRPFRLTGDTLILGDDRIWRRRLVRQVGSATSGHR